MSDPDIPTANPRTLRHMAIIGGALAVIILTGGTLSRLIDGRALKTHTAATAIPSVILVQARGAEAERLTLPGQLEPYAQAPVYARTSGYLRRWYADIGSKVSAGQVLADIETPEVDQQLAGAKAALKTATAERDLARATAERWALLLRDNAVSRQEADERAGAFAAREAMRQEAQAEVSRLQAISGFKRVVAPFDGVVTSRGTDIGALVGTSGGSPLFVVSDTARLRLMVQVPQPYLATIKAGSRVEFTVPEKPGESFTGTVSRQADALAPQSGAMQTEILVDNRDGSLKAGSFAQVRLEVTDDSLTNLRVPSSALLFRKEGTALAIVGPDNHVTIRAVRLGRDYGTEVEILSGISSSDRIIDSPSDAIAEGQPVKPVTPPKSKDTR
ncbi:efflux RND transporter periplasmic adaptor subunit [Asticcacaulis excentricus]|uniref:Probable Co/Zn/Cd efflux system membrane fusion protein n=1 Tax=Asticcacaulis excentricus TaxID=78587 RepID=A0A3G9G5Z2_9CAUL|nr:efflux RND transporter periplasmic adaptor subunit [Asticcacaulis excentricus]BBF82682.1 probable Co/Zn/Cd efflux system membrane fusion protein [Asticcacaulis excentricus]